MNAGEILTAAVLGGGVLAVAVQYGIAIGQQRREARIERQRGEEIRTLLEWVSEAWRKAR